MIRRPVSFEELRVMTGNSTLVTREAFDRLKDTEVTLYVEYEDPWYERAWWYGRAWWDFLRRKPWED